ncbi:MAG TPA: lytic transglycosylase domain-containing protein [Solirubrobacterales bacterium]|jgi:soluble lytic murein transglycosylase|nr:lytic transglycosylase domain-containing protein [Solirubrobacterales bacterium]HMU27917.1 lytic transglycosylase domain-containing protein [Solirubrobacterales bacterium]HMW46559.1 lytic transglycosylase domain-containing protein [Solirubrobacterales bacterium]HMX71606.1 lytic transglycosylase domain-containing protein [Solirubrobacterales bacterium]HMY25964.1 lytic transglycosylase domain-containing protein [Solirubrobacterales bacterium]
MAQNRTSTAGGRRRSNPAPRRGSTKPRTGAGRAFLILAGLIAVGILAILIISGLASKGIKEVALPLKHEDIIRQQSQEKGVDASLIAAVIYAESQFVDQTSHADARGLMQITPATAEEIEKLSGGTTFKLEDLRDPELNIRYGTFYLAHLLEMYDGDVVAALAAYNGGPGNANEWGGADMTIDDITFPETREYVKKVLEKQREYKHEYSLELGY